MNWILLAAEMFISRLAPTEHDKVRILRRRAFIYQEMNNTITDLTTRYADTTLWVLASAAIAEARLDNAALGRKHCEALLTIINDRGGPCTLQNMIPSLSIGVVVSFISIGVGDAIFSNATALHCALRHFSRRLLAMQAWNDKIRRTFANTEAAHEMRQTAFNDPYADTSRNLPSDNEISVACFAYQGSRHRAFQPLSALLEFVLPTFPDASPSGHRHHFSILWIINNTIYDLRNDIVSSTMFLDDLLHAVTASKRTACNEVSAGLPCPPLKALTVTYILASRAAKYGPTTPASGGILRTWAAVEPLEVLELTDNVAKRFIKVMLSQWLTGGSTSSPNMSRERLHDMTCGARNEWFKRRC
jgi:hypothetical protein